MGCHICGNKVSGTVFFSLFDTCTSWINWVSKWKFNFSSSHLKHPISVKKSTDRDLHIFVSSPIPAVLGISGGYCQCTPGTSASPLLIISISSGNAVSYSDTMAYIQLDFEQNFFPSILLVLSTHAFLSFELLTVYSC